jgi:F0F1-type ATP synthase assembly protein I
LKLFFLFINTIYWLWLCLCPVLILGLIGFWLYDKNKDNLPYFILLTLIGLGIGIAWAERVRKIKGTSRYFARILGSDDTSDELKS